MSAPLFTDSEAWLVVYLQTALTGRPEPYTGEVEVGIELPNPRPARYVTVRRDGGPQIDTFRETARFGINAWAETDEVVTDLTNLLRHLVIDAPNRGGPVRNATETAGPSTVPDDAGPRRYFAAELTFRAPS